MVLGTISNEGNGFLREADGRMYPNNYIEVLQYCFVHVTDAIFDEKWTLQKDNALIYISRKTEFLEGCDVDVLHWLTKCPHLNTLENV